MYVAPDLPAAPLAYPVCCVLPLATLCILAPVEWTCRALLAYADRADEIQFAGPTESVLLSGRWRAQRVDRAHLVRFELVEGPLPGLTCSMEARALDAGNTLLECDGIYLAPADSRKAGNLEVDAALLEWDGVSLAPPEPLLPDQYIQHLARGLRVGLLLDVERALASDGALHEGYRGDSRTERRGATRRPIALPILLRLGDVPWPGVMRDASASGVGLHIPAPTRQAPSIAALIAGHTWGTLEVLFDDGRLTAEVHIRRTQADATAVNVGLEIGATADGLRLRRRLAALSR